jgi:hypothetical protein
MSSIQKFNTLLPRLITEANTSTINWKLAAAIVKGKQSVSHICTNTDRSTCRGNLCGSLHAEAHAIIDYYGKDLIYSQRNGWCFLPRKGKKSKGKEK